MYCFPRRPLLSTLLLVVTTIITEMRIGGPEWGLSKAATWGIPGFARSFIGIGEVAKGSQHRSSTKLQKAGTAECTIMCRAA